MNIKKNVVYLVICLILSGCVSNQLLTETHFYTIDNPQSKGTAIFKIKHNNIVVSDIKMPNYMDSQSIIFKKNGNEIVKTSKNRWIDSLSELLNDSIKKNFTVNSSSTSNISVCERKSCYKLLIELHDFSGNDLGESRINYDWKLYNDKSLKCSGNLDKKSNILSDGYESLVNSLNRDWYQSLSELATKIDNCLDSIKE